MANDDFKRSVADAGRPPDDSAPPVPVQGHSVLRPSSFVIHEDDHLLVIHKPAGWNTHAPSPYAGEGVYDWLRHRDPRWAGLAILHRLDKETSGVLVFGKSAAANRSLTDQFTRRAVRKRYRMLTDRPLRKPELTAVSTIQRAGDRYVSRPLQAGGERAETRFRLMPAAAGSGRILIEAEPITGRTHQIRVHAAEHGFPILGDTLYGGTEWKRVCLHAASMTFLHPATGAEVTYSAEPGFDGISGHDAIRAAVIDPEQTDAWRCVHGASDGSPGWYVDKLGTGALSESEAEITPSRLDRIRAMPGITSIHHKRLDRHVRRTTKEAASPQLVWGAASTAPHHIRENGVQFELSFAEGYSVGLFLDQRDNRRRLLVNHVAAGFPAMPEGMAGREILNTFAYTCGFSVCAARAGARVTSLDLSRKYLDWGRRNFQLNGIDPAGHDFIHGDVFNWLGRLARKGRRFDGVLLDPPTFSQSKESGVFRAEKDYGRLVTAALAVLKQPGLLLASSNAAGLAAETFVAVVEDAVTRDGRRIARRHYAPQPPDFPISRDEPAYLKTLWLSIGE